jgi:hypothetical protein
LEDISDLTQLTMTCEKRNITLLIMTCERRDKHS